MRFNLILRVPRTALSELKQKGYTPSNNGNANEAFNHSNMLSDDLYEYPDGAFEGTRPGEEMFLIKYTTVRDLFISSKKSRSDCGRMSSKEMSESYFHTFLMKHKCDIVLPHPKREKRSAALIKRIEKLKVKQEEHLYHSMIKDITPISSSYGSHNRKSVNNVISLLGFALHMVLVAASMFATGYYIGEKYFIYRDPGNGKEIMRCGSIGGIIGLTLAIFVEICVVAIKMYRFEMYDADKKYK